MFLSYHSLSREKDKWYTAAVHFAQNTHTGAGFPPVAQRKDMNGFMQKQNERFSIRKTTCIAMMAAVVCVVTYFRFPLLGSKVHFANTMCLLGGLLLGPVSGGIAAGLGSAIYDIIAGYGAETLITFVSKFLMAWVAGMFVRKVALPMKLRVIVSAILGAFTYTFLYLLKTWAMQSFAYGLQQDAVWVIVVQKLPASLINAVLATVAGPVLYFALTPPLRRVGMPW